MELEMASLVLQHRLGLDPRDHHRALGLDLNDHLEDHSSNHSEDHSNSHSEDLHLGQDHVLIVELYAAEEGSVKFERRDKFSIIYSSTNNRILVRLNYHSIKRTKNK